MAGNGFSEEQLLTLTDDRALLIWYKLRGKPLFKGIEWSSLSAELIEEHDNFFTADELSELSNGKPEFKKAIESAIKRIPQGVLYAFYKSLWDSQGYGGATQHARIVEEIQTLATTGQQQLAFPTPDTHPPAHGPQWPSSSQLASAGNDRGLHVAQTDATATPNHPHWQPWIASAMSERQHSIAAESASHHCTDLPLDAQLYSLEHSRPARLSSRVESGPQALATPGQQQSAFMTPATHPPAHGPQWPSSSQLASAGNDQGEANGGANGQMGEWEDIVAFIRGYFDEKKTHRNVFCELLTEMLGVRASQYLRPSLSKQGLSAALQAVVQEHSMTWFQFAQYLLRAKSARPFIFEIEKHTGGGFISSVFKEVLKRHLGCSWQQLATAMGLPKVRIDAIPVGFVDNLQMQIDTFLEEYRFPIFESNQRTAQFLVESLEKAGLTHIAANVKTDLENTLNIGPLESLE